LRRLAQPRRAFDEQPSDGLAVLGAEPAKEQLLDDLAQSLPGFPG
jgi:hypothetical protein